MSDEESVGEAVVGSADPRKGVADIGGGAALRELNFDFCGVPGATDISVGGLDGEDSTFVGAVSDGESEFALTRFDGVALERDGATGIGDRCEAKAIEEAGGLEVFADAFEGGF